MNPAAVPPTTVTVAPTTTTVQTFDTSKTKVLSIQVTNLDPSQTFAGAVQTRARADFAEATVPFVDTGRLELSSIGPGASGRVDVDAVGAAEVRVTGSMSGAGGNVSITARDVRA